MTTAQNTAFLGNPHRISVSDNIRVGGAEAPTRDKNSLGVPLNGAEGQHFVNVSLGAPAAAAANNVALSQAVVGPGAPVVLNGALVTGGVATLDVARNVVAAWTNAAVLTVTGKDEYGQTMSEVSASGTSFTGNKAFKTITSIAISASVTGLTAGTGAKLGLPYRPEVGGFLRGILGENTADAGTYAAPERGASTTGTNDVRGTYTTAGAMNGANVYRVSLAIRGGPDAFYAYGIPQA